MTILEPICFNCIHFNIEEGICDAFMVQIPEDILNGDNDHSKPLPNQGNNIVFQAKDVEKFQIWLDNNKWPQS